MSIYVNMDIHGYIDIYAYIGKMPIGINPENRRCSADRPPKIIIIIIIKIN